MWAENIVDQAAVDPETAVVSADTRARLAKRIRAVIQRLPKQQRQIMSMVYDGLTVNQVSKKIGKKPDTVKTHIRNAKHRLLMILAEDAIHHLPPENALALRLHLDGLTYEETAEKMSLNNEEIVKTLVGDAKHRLFRMLTADGFHELIEKPFVQS